MFCWLACGLRCGGGDGLGKIVSRLFALDGSLKNEKIHMSLVLCLCKKSLDILSQTFHRDFGLFRGPHRLDPDLDVDRDRDLISLPRLRLIRCNPKYGQ